MRRLHILSKQTCILSVSLTLRRNTCLAPAGLLSAMPCSTARMFSTSFSAPKDSLPATQCTVDHLSPRTSGVLSGWAREPHGVAEGFRASARTCCGEIAKNHRGAPQVTLGDNGRVAAARFPRERKDPGK